MDPTFAAFAAGATGAAALGVTAVLRLAPEFISARRLATRLAQIDSPKYGTEIIDGVRRVGRERGKVRSSNIIGMVNGALRRRDGSYMRAYRVTPKMTMLGHSHDIDARYEQIARMLGSNKPEGTLISFRSSSDLDPGELLDEHAATRAEIEEVHPSARMLHDTGLSYLKGRALSGIFRRDKLSLWVSVPSVGGDNTGQGVDAFISTLLSELKKDGVKNITAAVARANAASASERITRRMIKEEENAYREAEKVFRQIERECPLKIERYEPQETFDALYLSHHQNANSAPPLTRPMMLNMQQYLCGESIEYGGWYLLHGKYPVAMVSIFTAPQPKIVPTSMRHLTANPKLNFRHSVVTQFICLKKEKEKGKVETRKNKIVQACTDLKGNTNFTTDARETYKDLDAIDEQLTNPSESVVHARTFVLIYGDPVNNHAELEASVRKLDDYCEEIITAIRYIPGADAAREEPGDFRFLYHSSIAGEEIAFPKTGREHTEVGDSLSCLALTESAFTGTRKPHTFFYTTTGRIFGHNLFDTSITSSPVVLVISGQGGGKSNLMAHLANDVLSEVPRAAVYITDFGESFAPLCKLVQGRHYRFVEGDPRAINIWDYPGLESGIMPSKRQQQLVTGFYINLAGIEAGDKTTQKIIKKAVAEVYRNEVPYNRPDWPKHEPTLSHFLDVVKKFPWEKGEQKDRANALYLALEEYKGDPWLDAETHDDYKVEASLHVFEMDSLYAFEPELKAAIAYTVAALITRSTGKLLENGTRTPTVHIYDEFWKIEAEFPEMIYPVRKDTRQGRKDMVITMIGTHAYEDLTSLYGVISNAGTRIIGLQNKGFDQLAADANLSEAAIAAVKAIHNVEGSHAEYVISIGSGVKQVVEMVRVEYSPVQKWTYTSNAVERNARSLVENRLPEWTDWERVGWLSANFQNGLAHEGKTENDKDFLALLEGARMWSEGQQREAQLTN